MSLSAKLSPYAVRRCTFDCCLEQLHQSGIFRKIFYTSGILAPNNANIQIIRRYWIIALLTALLGAFATPLLTSYVAAYRTLGEEISKNTLSLSSDNIYSDPLSHQENHS